MEKKEFFKTEEEPKFSSPGFSSKISGFSSKLFGIIKFILGICLLPFVYSLSAAFLGQLGLIERPLQSCFWSGVVSFLIIYLFIWEAAVIYAKGQKLLEIIFTFFKPLVRLAPYVLPVYTILLFIVYGLLSLVIKSAWLIQYSMFLIGFTAALHLVFSAKSIRSKKSDFLKANYIFGFFLVYLINLTILAFCANLVFKDFSFIKFSNNSYQAASDIFYAVFRQLFLR
ncbi:MAG: hypothetical protein WC723_05985 [Candidatus Omnitrophota bacterium]